MVTIQVTNSLSNPLQVGKSGQRNPCFAGDLRLASHIPKLDVRIRVPSPAFSRRVTSRYSVRTGVGHDPGKSASGGDPVDYRRSRNGLYRVSAPLESHQSFNIFHFPILFIV